MTPLDTMASALALSQSGEEATCPSCANRTKADASWDSNGGDFWWCSALPILPAFNGMTIRHGDTPENRGSPINLKLFAEGSSYAPGLNARSCPLYTALTE